MTSLDNRDCIEVIQDGERQETVLVSLKKSAKGERAHPNPSSSSPVTRESRNPSATSGQQSLRGLKKLTETSKRSNSLEAYEEAFLEQFVVDRNNLQSQAHDEEGLSASRRELKRSIADKAATLTPAERDFLIHLAESPNVSSEYLIRSARVLFHDPLFKLDKDTAHQTQEVKQPSFRQHDASFRMEVWTHFSPPPLKRQIAHAVHTNVDEPKIPHGKVKNSLGKRFFPKLLKRRRKPTSSSSLTNKQENDLNESELEIKYDILGTSANDKDCSPHVLSPPIMHALRAGLPVAIQHDNFWLKYSMLRDGTSMRIMLQKIRSSTRTVLAIETMDGDVFGAYTSSPWHPHGHEYFGSCEAFVWRMRKSRFTRCLTVEDQILLESKLDIFPWSGNNRNVQSLESLDGHLIVGGGAHDNDANQSGGCGLRIDADMMNGFSDPCITFASPSLRTRNPKDSFAIANMEVWTLTPVNSVALAEKLEFARQFVFEHALKRN